MPIYDEARVLDWKGHLDTLSKRPGEVEFILSYAQKIGGPVLELACCAGRMTVELAKENFEVYGLDASWPAIEMGFEATKKLTQEVGARIHFIQGDMCCFSFRRQFPLIIIAYNSFWFNLNENEAEQCIKCIMDNLQSGGLFLIDKPEIYRPEHLNVDDDIRKKWWKAMAVKYNFEFTIKNYCFWARTHELKKNQAYLMRDQMLVGKKL